ncbi:segregation and condensation protein B [Stella humosa]|uniref:Segregation and condensation protein B n=1 Tax=Stella humosa TaxID=94 RepID=A0A3N1LXH1_9PROT|nr:SMC-Scp complex subunit ScpB [Stella humosa]ROP99883.1 segregation and condensation protein B [Stella humosa]BBK30887.1 segregation and condensation protein B [Stella humosa]
MSQLEPELRLAEALLFAAAEPLDAQTIASRMPEGTDIEALMERLTAIYADRGVQVVRVAGRFAMRTAPDLAGALRLERTVTRKPTRASIETLAIIAYHQPVTRAEIEEIRGVALSRGTLETLMEASWIRPKGRRQTPGRPATWVTTDQFLAHFGLDQLADLPGIDELKAAGLLDQRPVLNPLPSELETPVDDGDDEREDPAEVPPEDADDGVSGGEHVRG